MHDYALAPPASEEPPTPAGAKGGGGKKGGAKPRKPPSGPPPGPSLVGWTSLVPSFTYDAKMPFFRILVPTVDTVRSAFLLRAELLAGKPTLLAGGSGVGKSVLVQRVLAEVGEVGEWLAVGLNFSAQVPARPPRPPAGYMHVHRPRSPLAPCPRPIYPVPDG